MLRLARLAFFGITTVIVTLAIFLWHDSGTEFSANLGNIIRTGSDGEVSTSSTDLQLPEIPGSSAEKKVDRATLTLINIILYTCGTIAGIMIIVGGIRYIISFGSEDGQTGARKTILWACGGLLMVMLAWAIVLNVVRIASTGERLDSSQSPIAGQCGPTAQFGCKDICCACSSNDPGNDAGCNAGLQCGGPLDIVIFEGVSELEDEIRVCQPIPQ